MIEFVLIKNYNEGQNDIDFQNIGIVKGNH